MLNSHSRFIEEDAIRLLRNDPSKVDLWRSFEGQQGARMTEKEKKTDFTASPAAEFSASSSLFFFSLCRELFLLLFPVTSARYLETPRSFDHKRHRCKVAETVLSRIRTIVVPIFNVLITCQRYPNRNEERANIEIV